MNIKQILEFIKKTLENNALAVVRSLKAHIFTVRLLSNKVEVTNPFKLPSIVRVRETNPYTATKDIQKQTDEYKKALVEQIKKVNLELAKLKPYSEVTITNLKEIKPLESIRIKNPQRTVSINNFYEIQKELGKIQKSIKELKLDPKIIVPDVIVPEIKIPDIKQPEIKNNILLDQLEKLIGTNPKKYVPVRLTDGEKFYEALSELVETVSGGGGGKYAFQDTTGERTYGLVNTLRQLIVVNEERWGLNNSEKVGTTTYTGEEDVDGNWIVRKIVKTGSNIQMSYATIKNNPAITDYQDAWDDRATLEYGRFSVAFSLE